jgi:mRNA interferase MazF
MVITRFEVYLVNLDPTVGSEIQKTRPCLVVSPDEMNHHIRTAMVAPMGELAAQDEDMGY